MDVRKSLSGAQTESFLARQILKGFLFCRDVGNGGQYGEDGKVDVEKWRQLAVSLS